MAGVDIKDNALVLDQVPCIYYPICFKENKVQILIDSGSKVNVMTPVFILKLGLNICPINLGPQKINYSTFKMFEMALASFQIENKLGQT